MPTITNIDLRFVSQTASQAKLEVKWGVSFNSREIATTAVYNVNLFLQNIDGLGDADVRRRQIGTGYVAAQAQPLEFTVPATVDRSFLNEDFQVFGLGDTTDEWVAEVVLTPYKLPAETKRRSDELRREFEFTP